MMVVPAAVAGGLGHDFVVRHLTLSIGIGIVWVALSGYVSGVYSAQMKRAVDATNKWLLGEDASYEKAYLESVRAEVRYHEDKGLPFAGRLRISLADTFLDPGVAAPDPWPGEGVLPQVQDPAAGRSSLADLLRDQAGQGEVIAVIGAPGSGKTTLLRYIAYQASDRKTKHRGTSQSARIPVLLYMRTHADSIVANPRVSLSDLYKAAAKEPDGWLQGKLDAGQCLILLDGLDEVAQRDHRSAVAAWVERQHDLHPRNQFVITSRPGGYQSAPVTGARPVQVCGFTSRQVEDFIGRWYAAAAASLRLLDSAHGAAEESRPSGKEPGEAASELWQLIQRTPAIYDLTVNPLLLTMIAYVYRETGALPRRRTHLYSEICRVILGARAEAKRLTQRLPTKEKTTILAALAYAMMTEERNDLGKDQALGIITALLAEMNAPMTSEEFLEAAGHDGLFIEQEAGYYAFAHKTLQEYLAAIHIRDTQGDRLLTALTGMVNDPWWAETSIFYAAETTADPIVKACLEARTSTALALACECADEAPRLAPGLRDQVNAILADATNLDSHANRSPGEARQLAGILLARHLRHRALTSQGSQVCVNPIPSGIYRVFLASTSAPAPDAPEENLRSSDTFAVGVREDDAAGFCAWANDALGHQASYRLPQPAEIEELARQQRIPALADGYLPHTSPASPGGNSPAEPPNVASSARQTDPAVRVDSLADHLRSDPEMSLGLKLIEIRIRARLLGEADSHHLVRVLNSPFASDRDLSSTFASDHRPIGISLALIRAIVSALTRAIANASDLTHAIASADNLASARAGVSASGRSRSRNLDLASDLRRAFALARASASSLARDLERACNLAGDLDRDPDLDRAFVRDLVRELVRDLGLGLARANDLSFDLALPQDHRLDRALAHDHGLNLDRASDLALKLVRDLARDLARASDLAFRLAAGPWPQGHPQLSVVRFQELDHVASADGQFNQSAVDKCKRLVAGQAVWAALGTSDKGPDALASHGDGRVMWHLDASPLPAEAVAKATAALVDALKAHPGGDTLAPWASSICARLEASVMPILDRTEHVTPGAAAEIRLMAVCLAEEADAAGRPDIGDQFRGIAAEVTWLEQRRSGVVPAREVIMLAVE